MTVKKTLLLSDLIEDLSIYPRHAIDSVHVGDLVQALQSGHTLPPIVVDAKSKRIVDGWHRVRAYRRVLGEEGSIEIELRTYKNEADLIADAITMNTTHGRKLDRQDLIRAGRMAIKAGITEKKVAFLLHVTEQKVEKLLVRIAIAPRPSPATVPETNELPLKRPFIHLEGKKLTAEQVEAHRGQGGTSLLLQARQLKDALATELADREDVRLVAMLKELQEEIGRWLIKRKAVG